MGEVSLVIITFTSWLRTKSVESEWNAEPWRWTSTCLSCLAGLMSFHRVCKWRATWGWKGNSLRQIRQKTAFPVKVVERNYFFCIATIGQFILINWIPRQKQLSNTGVGSVWKTFVSHTTVPLMILSQQRPLTGFLSIQPTGPEQLAPTSCSSTLPHHQFIYLLPGQTEAEWPPLQEAVITVNQRPGADIVKQLCHCGRRVMTSGHTMLH